MKKIIFYELPSGRKPIVDFLDSLSSKEAQKVTWVLKLIEDLERVQQSIINNFQILVVL